MRAVRVVIYLVVLIVVLTFGAYLFAVASAQSVTRNLTESLDPNLKPDFQRVAHAQLSSSSGARKGAYKSSRAERVRDERPRPNNADALGRQLAHIKRGDLNVPATTGIGAGTPLSRLLHTSQLSLSSAAGTDEQFVDRNGDLIADERTTFDSVGGSFDIDVGQSGARYEVYSATLNNTLVGVLVVALDTNGDYVVNTSSTFDLQRDFGFPSAAAVVSGTSRGGREFVVVSSSGYYNAANPNDPNNEASPGVVLLVRDPNTGGFDNSLTRELVKVGDNKLYNANALALMPNNDLLIADFHSDELRIIRDTDADGMPDTLDTTPYYSYQFSNDAPLDIAVNSRGIVFSHSAGNDTVMLAIYDDNSDGRGDRDEVVVEGLSIDNNLFLHGLTVDRRGNVYVIEDASASFDGSAGNAGTARIDVFPDGGLNGLLSDGAILSQADSASLALTGLSLGAVSNPINDAQYFVRQHYLDFLGREPDAGGLGYWSDQISGCGTNDACIRSRRTGVSAAFFVEQEFHDTGGFVYRIYRSSLARRPTFAEFGADRSHVVGGTDLEARKQAFADEFVLRSGFLQVYPLTQTPEQFVGQLFDTAGLVPFTTERQKFADDMRSGKTRGQVLREVVEIDVFKNREYNPSFVLMQYFGYLQRDPDQGGLDFWLNVLNNRDANNYRGMVCSFITSREYQERFGLLLRRTNTDCAE